MLFHCFQRCNSGVRADQRRRRSTQALLDRLHDHVHGLCHGDRPIVLQSVVALRTLLPVERERPIQQIIDCYAGYAVPRLVELMRTDEWEEVQFEPTTEQTQEVAWKGALNVFVGMLQSESDRVRDLAVWGLGTIAGDCVAFRDAELELGMMNLMLKEVLRVSSDSVWGQAVWAVSNLCRGFPKPPLELILPCPQVLSEVIISVDEDVNIDAICALNYICEGGPRGIDALEQANIIPRLFWFIKQKCKDPNSVKNKIIMSSLKVFSSWFEYGARDQTERLLHMGLVECMNELSNGIAANAFDLPRDALEKVGEIVGYICRYGSNRINEISAIFPLLSTDILHRMRILWAVARYGTDAQRESMLADRIIIHDFMSDFTTYRDLIVSDFVMKKYLLVVLKSLTRWLAWGNKSDGTNEVLVALTTLDDVSGGDADPNALQDMLIAVVENKATDENCRKYGRYLLAKYFPQYDGRQSDDDDDAVDELEGEEEAENEETIFSPRPIEDFLNADDDFLQQLQGMRTKLSKLHLLDESYVNEMMTAQPKKAGFLA